jgi:hypothetical protein
MHPLLEYKQNYPKIPLHLPLQHTIPLFPFCIVLTLPCIALFNILLKPKEDGKKRES